MGSPQDFDLVAGMTVGGNAFFNDSLQLTTDERGAGNVEPDRLLFINTALRAVPGRTLCTFFAPIMGVKRNLLNRKRLTEGHMLSDPGKTERLYNDAVRILTRALVDASAEVFDVAAPIDEKELAAALRGKLVPQCYEPGTVLAYPGEFPEVMFVHVILTGSVQVAHYQVQSRRMGFSEGSRRQYFVSNDVLRLSGALGYQPELLRFVNTASEPLSDAASDMASISNVSATAHRNMRRMSRMMGQPTLQLVRTELSRAPYVLCAQEALGLEPFRLTTVTAEATSPFTKGNEVPSDSRIIQTMRIRASDLHNVLVQLALSRSGSKRCGSPTAGGNRHASALVDCISLARVRCIYHHYPLNEILMRQSWLLQDTPAYTIRALVTQLAPRSYLPGEVILCPHSTNRHLSFLRRGTMTIEEAPPVEPHGSGVCQCGLVSARGNVLQEVPQGASFGELSVLFGEPRQFVLRAKTPCDIWSLSRQSFAATIRRDDALRASLLSKAAALRMRWLGEQRYTAVLADKLRECCELFRYASDSFIRLIQERVEPVVYPPGKLLTSSSSRCMEMLIITHGKVSSIVDGVAEYGPGSVIGEPTIILHRWPLGLVSKSMVEGWKLTRQQLRDALERVEILRQHSGEVAGHVQQLMQSIFAPPVPPCGVDAVGRSRMPIVGPPPYGKTYFEYAEWLAEGQLKALCFKHREYVSWKDISYSTLSAPGERGRSKLRKLSGAFDIPAVGEQRNTLPAVKRATIPQPPKAKKRRDQRRKVRPVSAGSTFPFHINPIIGRQLVAHPNSAKQPAGVSAETDPFLATQRALTSAFREKTCARPLPQLWAMKKLLECRDKLMKVEAKQNKLNDSKQERMNVVDVTESSGLAPIHIFLHGNNPRVHITVEEAVAVGYVLQFPDTKRIQSCVSNIDSDVTLGLPQHRQRRRDMAFTPNDRHTRYCFLFAASQLGERSAEEVLLHEAAVLEAQNKERAQHLTSLLIAQLPEKHRVSSEQQTTNAEAENAVSGEWRGVSMPVSSPNTTTAAASAAPQRQLPVVQPKEVANEAFLQHLHDSPEQAIGQMRMKFQVGADNTEEAEEGNGGATRPGGDIVGGTASDDADAKSDLLDRLRSATAPTEVDKEEDNADLPPRRPSVGIEEGSGSRTPTEGDRAMEKYFKKGEVPLFVDGYGELSTMRSKSTVDTLAVQAESIAPVHVAASEQWCTDSAHIPGASNTTCAWMPQNFTMPTVSEAMATMRLIQSDVDGLNAVAQEQRRERMLKRNANGGAGAFDPATATSTSAESQRLVDEWVSEYRGHARDPLCPARIPPLLLAEAGTDYLAEEFRQTRRQHIVAEKEAHGVEIWRGEVDTRGRRDGKHRLDSAAPECGRCVLAAVGASKLGFPSEPLRNPASNMSAEEYERWISERDAIFAAQDCGK